MARQRALKARERRTANGPPATAPAPSRIVAVDVARGLAVIAMVAYHFCFDLAHVGLAGWNFYRDPFWLHARTAILSSFLLLAGVSLVLADRHAAARRGFWRHVATIAGCALLVTIATLAVFPRSFIWFGVLHAIAVSLVLVRPLVRRPWPALAVGLAVIAAGNLIAAPAFDARALGWIGFATVKPVTEDYVPLFPWMGVILLGVAAAHLLARGQFHAIAPLSRLPRGVALAGRHSLAIYMVHQPVLMGIAWAMALAAGRQSGFG